MLAASRRTRTARSCSRRRVSTFSRARGRETRSALWSPWLFSASRSGIADLILAGRFDVGVGGGGEQLVGPLSILEYLGRVAGDFTAGFTLALVCRARPRRGRRMAARGCENRSARRPDRRASSSCPSVASPASAELGDSTSPESRHLIFVLPVLRAASSPSGCSQRLARRLTGVVVGRARCSLLAAEVAWGWDKTPPALRGRALRAIEARKAASAWLAADARPDDVLFGYEPALPRRLGARAHGLLETPSCPGPTRSSRSPLYGRRAALGRGVWVFDASDTNNFTQSMHDPAALPDAPARSSRRACSDRSSSFAAESRRGPRARSSSRRGRRSSSVSRSTSATRTSTCVTVDRALRSRLERGPCRVRARSSPGSRARPRRPRGPPAVVALPAGAASGRGNHRRGADQAADEEGAQPLLGARRRRPWDALLRRAHLHPRRPAPRRDRPDGRRRSSRTRRARRRRGRRRRAIGERRRLGGRARREGALRRQAGRRRRRRDRGGASSRDAASTCSGRSPKGATASSSRWSTPDGERTMLTDRGVAPELRAEELEMRLVSRLRLAPPLRLLAPPQPDRRGRRQSGRRCADAGRPAQRRPLVARRGIAAVRPMRSSSGWSSCSPTSCSGTRRELAALGADALARSAGREARRAPASARRRARAACCPRRGRRHDRRRRRAGGRVPRRRARARGRGGGAVRGAARSDAVIRLAREVEEALRSRGPVVALETTLVAHGFPPGEGVAVALEAERRVREAGALPATIGVLDGAVRVGLGGGRARALHRRRAQGGPARPRRLRSPGQRSERRRSAARSPSAARPGSASWPPAGIGGVHRGERLDVSADLGELGRTEALVVCSGAKSLLDVPATAELLETLGVPVLGYRTDTLPLFYAAHRRPAGLGPGRVAPRRRPGSREHTGASGDIRRSSSPGRRTRASTSTTAHRDHPRRGRRSGDRRPGRDPVRPLVPARAERRPHAHGQPRAGGSERRARRRGRGRVRGG